MSEHAYMIRKLLDDADREDLSEDDYDLVPHTAGRSILATSNRETILADMSGPEEIDCAVCNGEGVIGPADDRDHCKECDGYGKKEATWVSCIDCGSDGVLVHKQSKAGQEWISALDGYPVADESDYSERESEAEQEAWSDYGRDDMRRELARYVDARLDWLGETPIRDADELIAELTDSQIDTIYHTQVEAHLGGESVTWEEDYDGTNAVFHIDRVVWGDDTYESRQARRNGTPTWHANAWDGLVPVADTSGQVTYTTGEVDAWEPIVDITPRCTRCDAPCPRPDGRDVYHHGLWYDDCWNPVCDVPTPGDSPIAKLAYAALLGDKDSLAVLQDATEETDPRTAAELRGRQGGWSLRPELAKAYQRAALKRLAMA